MLGKRREILGSDMNEATLTGVASTVLGLAENEAQRLVEEPPEVETPGNIDEKAGLQCSVHYSTYVITYNKHMRADRHGLKKKSRTTGRRS